MSNSQIQNDPVRDDILEGARQLFERFGFKKTTMEDIARQIGKSKSALYYYYKTKEEIFEASIMQEMEQQRTRAEEAMKEVESAAEKFQLLFTTVLSDVKEKANRFTIFRAELNEDPLLLINITKKHDTFLQGTLKDILILGISRGEIKMMNNAEMDAWAKMANWTIKSIGHKLFLEEEYAYLETHFSFLAKSLFHGVAK